MSVLQSPVTACTDSRLRLSAAIPSQHMSQPLIHALTPRIHKLLGPLTVLAFSMPMRQNRMIRMILASSNLLCLLFILGHAILAQRSSRTRDTDVETPRDTSIPQVALNDMRNEWSANRLIRECLLSCPIKKSGPCYLR